MNTIFILLICLVYFMAAIMIAGLTWTVMGLTMPGEKKKSDVAYIVLTAIFWPFFCIQVIIGLFKNPKTYTDQLIKRGEELLNSTYHD